MTKPYLSIILPAHNEALRLSDSLEKIKQFVDSQSFLSEVLVVENASSDDTLRIARLCQEDFPQLKVIHLDQPGKGNAIRTGMLAASGQYRFMADVDLSMPVDEILNFLPPKISEPQVVIGSREKEGSKRIGEPFYRHLVGRVFNLLVRVLVLPGIQDTQCGFKCFSASAAESVFPHQTLDGWSFDVEVLGIARSLGYEVVEVSITWVYHPGSRMHLIRDSWKMFKEILLIRRNKRKGLYNGKEIRP